MIKEKANLKADTFANMFRYQAGIYSNALDGVGEAAALERPTPDNNHINWIAGHIVHCRHMLVERLGVAAEHPFGDLYWKSIEDKRYPKLAEIGRQFSLLNKHLDKVLLALTDEELDFRPAPDQPTKGDMIAFFVYHEAYHLGQIGYARKAIGLSAMKSH